MKAIAEIDRCKSLPHEKEVTELVKPEDKKTREYNMFDYSNDKKLMPDEFDTSVLYIDVND